MEPIKSKPAGTAYYSNSPFGICTLVPCFCSAERWDSRPNLTKSILNTHIQFQLRIQIDPIKLYQFLNYLLGSVFSLMSSSCFGFGTIPILAQTSEIVENLKFGTAKFGDLSLEGHSQNLHLSNSAFLPPEVKCLLSVDSEAQLCELCFFLW